MTEEQAPPVEIEWKRGLYGRNDGYEVEIDGWAAAVFSSLKYKGSDEREYHWTVHRVGAVNPVGIGYFDNPEVPLRIAEERLRLALSRDAKVDGPSA